MSEILNAKIKNSDIFDLNKKISALVAKAELQAEQDKIVKI